MSIEGCQSHDSLAADMIEDEQLHIATCFALAETGEILDCIIPQISEHYKETSLVCDRPIAYTNMIPNWIPKQLKSQNKDYQLQIVMLNSLTSPRML